MTVTSVRIMCGLFIATVLLAGGTATTTGASDPFLSRVRQLTFEGSRSGEGYFSKDGKALVFQSEREPRNPFYQIYILDLLSGDTKRVSPGVGKTTCSFFHPGGAQVLFASTHLDPEATAKQKAELDFRASGKTRRYSWDYDEQMDIFTTDRDGGSTRRLTHAQGYDAEGAFSPDGNRIVFCSLRHAYKGSLARREKKLLETDPSYFGEIYIMHADGSEQTRLTNVPGYDGGPFFSPDGTRIVWRRFDESGAIADIYTMKLDGSDTQRLTDFGAMSWAPYFHPSGEYVIFASNKLGFSNFELNLVDALGRVEPVRVTHREGFDGLPVFSPDGKKLCWTSNATPENQSQLFLAEWNHQAAMVALGNAPVRRSPDLNLSVSVPPGTGSTLSPGITVVDLKSHVSYLASDKLEGRLTGSQGIRQAADYIRQKLAEAGLQPLGGSDGDWLHSFEFTGGVEVLKERNDLLLTSGDKPEKIFQLDHDFRPFAFTANGELEGEVVFAGYGLNKPGELGIGYDSYAGLDVKDKNVLVLRYVPEEVTPERRQELNRYAGLRYKALIARNNGARAILVVTGPNSPKPGALAGLGFDSSMAGSGIPAISISGETAEAILAPSGKSLKQLQSSLDKENPHAQGGFVIPDVKLRLQTAVKRIRKRCQNVIGLLPPEEKKKNAEFVLLGAHYDHLGFGETGGFGVKGEEGQIHNGADDNASGVAVLLELAAKLGAVRKGGPGKFQRGVVFGFWSGEEMGLIGSARFAAKPTFDLGNTVAYLNFDMVGRLRDNKLTLQGIGSSSAWKGLLERRNVLAGFDLKLQKDPYLPTDTTSFYPKGIPVLAFFTGSHEQYHRPADDLETLNYEGLNRITRFAGSLVRDLAGSGSRPDYVKVKRADQGGNRDALRIYLGTIPDYASEVKGVKLTGVRAGGPADKAGLKGGDIIVKFAGKEITNIYDYTYALDAAKVGQPLKLEVLRRDNRLGLTIVPEARK